MSNKKSFIIFFLEMTQKMSVRKMFSLFLLMMAFLYLKLADGGALNDEKKENRHKNLSSAMKAAKLDDDYSALKKLSSAQIQKMTRKCQCERTELAKMTPLIMTNIADSKPIRLWYEKSRPLGEGTYSKVFHAELAEIGGKIFNKCVALKMTLKDLQNSDWQKHIKEWRIQKAFDALEERRHVIKLFAFGYHTMSKKNYVFSILELGRGDLIRHMKRRRYEWFKNNAQPDDRIIEADIRQLVETVRDMHQKIMHLDLKPSNLVFVREGKGPSVMKAIDFGASQFIDEHQRGDEAQKQQANACKWFVSNDPVTTEWYQSPEHHNQCNWGYIPEEEHSMELSSKSDIWAIGIIAIEMAAIGSEFKWMFDENPIKDSEDIVAKVYEVMGELWRICIQNKNDLRERMEKDWENFHAIFSLILRVRSRFPRLFHIITAVLVHEPERRPTAKGILDFLDGKCRFESMRKPSRLFPWLTMDQFRARLAKRKSQLAKAEANEVNSDTKRSLRKRVGEAETLLRLAIGDEWGEEEEEEEKQRDKPCDTTTNGGPTAADEEEMMAPMNAENSAVMGWKNRVAKIEKTIGLSLSPRIQNAYESMTKKYAGLLDNLQDSFYDSHFEIVLSMGKEMVGLLWTIGYGKMLAQLDAVSERYQRDAAMLKKIVDALRKQLGAEWEEIYEMGAQFECEAGDDAFVNAIDRISALYLYELMYEHLLGQFAKGGVLHSSLQESARASFLFNWLHVILKNLKKFRAEKEKGVLATLRTQKEQFEKQMETMQKEWKETTEKRRDEYRRKLADLEEIEGSVEEEMKLIRRGIEQNKDRVHNTEQHQQGKSNYRSNQEKAVSILLNQNFELLLAKKESEEMLAEVNNKRAFLDEEFEDEMMRVQLDYEKAMGKVQQGLTLCTLVERKMGQFGQQMIRQ